MILNGQNVPPITSPLVYGSRNSGICLVVLTPVCLSSKKLTELKFKRLFTPWHCLVTQQYVPETIWFCNVCNVRYYAFIELRQGLFPVQLCQLT